MEQMKRTFKHLQYRDRIKIEMMLREKASIQQIADRLHVTYQTIWRELRRDGVWYEHTLSNLTTERRYSADIAQAQYEKNKRAKGGMIKLGHDFALHDFIEQKIGREHYSPRPNGRRQEKALRTGRRRSMSGRKKDTGRWTR